MALHSYGHPIVGRVLVTDLRLANWLPRTLLPLVAFGNLVLFVFICIYGAFSLTLVIHKIIWPVIEKPIYTRQRVGIVQRTKLLGLAGIALVGFALGATPGLVKDIVGKIVD